MAGGTSNGSGYGSSSASSDATPVCNVNGEISTPRAARSVTTAGVNGRLALGISALPGTRANTVWYHARSQSRVTYEYRIGAPCLSR